MSSGQPALPQDTCARSDPRHTLPQRKRNLHRSPRIPHHQQSRRIRRKDRAIGWRSPHAVSAARVAEQLALPELRGAISHLKDWRRVATRYDKLARNFRATVSLALNIRALPHRSSAARDDRIFPRCLIETHPHLRCHQMLETQNRTHAQNCCADPDHQRHDDHEFARGPCLAERYREASPQWPGESQATRGQEVRREMRQIADHQRIHDSVSKARQRSNRPQAITARIECVKPRCPIKAASGWEITRTRRPTQDRG